MTDTRSFNVGASDYCVHKYQPWSWWIKFKLNPFDADIVKRVLRTKATDPRLMDYKKIKHIASERISQINNNINVWSFEINEPNSQEITEMTKDYSNLVEEDFMILCSICYPSKDRINDYNIVIKNCDVRIKELEI